ncbi:MAG: sialate O-acetylesterase [Verrucomicrobia bacterium]|nr:MAG: sialate O-acetylesterase [Verrucomicrobiota bacterium]
MRHRLILLASALATMPASADVRLPKIFTDNMMLQRDLPVHVWGWADAGEAVSVTLSGKTAATKADAKGQWSLALPAIKSGENLELLVKGNNSLTLKNVIIGDIWVCGGQSNMEMVLNGCLGVEDDIKTADLPKIRRIKINHAKAIEPQTDAPNGTAQWQVCASGTARGFTAVGFYFAREIVAKTGVPIGLMDDCWGATRIEPWTPNEGLALVDELKPELVAQQDAQKAYLNNQMPKALTAMEAWIALTKQHLASGVQVTPAPVIPTNPAIEGWSGMYNAMIHPLVHFPIKGALWYQGEANGGESDSYYHKMRAMIGGWRKAWGLGEFPFYFAQLANFQAASEEPAGGDGWSKVRAAQTKSLAIPNTGMAVIIDTVPLAEKGDIHPKNKFDVGMRLARWALNRDYGQKQLEVSGPLFKALTIDGGKACLAFDHVGAGLMVGKKEGRNPTLEDKGGKLARFAIAGEDKKWVWADAVIVGKTVVVSSAAVPQPVAVRYAFTMNPDGCNLYNKDGLPASPFRTDAW